MSILDQSFPLIKDKVKFIPFFSFDILPKELYLIMFSYFSCEELENMKFVCNRWHFEVTRYFKTIQGKTIGFPRSCGHCHYFDLSLCLDVTDNSQITEEFILVYFESIKKKLIIGDIIDLGQKFGKFIFHDGLSDFLRCQKLNSNYSSNMFGDYAINSLSQKFVRLGCSSQYSIGVTTPLYISDVLPFPQGYWKDYCSHNFYSYHKTPLIMRPDPYKNINLKVINKTLPIGLRFETIEKTFTHYSGYNNVMIEITKPDIIKLCIKNIGKIDYEETDIRCFSTFFEWGGYRFTAMFDKYYPRTITIKNMKETYRSVKSLIFYYDPMYINKHKEEYSHDIIFIKCDNYFSLPNKKYLVSDAYVEGIMSSINNNVRGVRKFD